MVAIIEQFKEKVAKKGGCLSPAFIAWLEAGVPCRISHPRLGKREWWTKELSAERGGLLENINFNGIDMESWEIADGYTSMLAEMGKTVLEGPALLPLETFKKGVVFAADNCDFLFLLPDSSVWCFYHDGCDVHKISKSWEIWIKGMKNLDSDLTPELPKDKDLIGIWEPVSSKTVDEDLFEIRCPIIHLMDTGKVVLTNCRGVYSEEATIWSTKDNILTITSGYVGAQSYAITIEGDELDMVSLTRNYHCRLKKKPG